MCIRDRYHGRADFVYAQQDEAGHIYYMKLGDKKAAYSKFAGHGDYEDIAIMGEQVFILRSDGALFTFPFKSVRDGNISDVIKFENLFPAGEYEGMYADEKEKELYVLCKNCKEGKDKNFVPVYYYKMLSSGNYPYTKVMGYGRINIKQIEARLGKSKITFRPSALAKNPATGEWYILSSVNKLLVVADAALKIKEVYPLKASLFLQPEGIAFDDKNNLYISNEGDKATKATVLKFNYKK